MNKIIQEILEDLKNKEITVDDLTHNDKTKLLDYITSLEEIIDGLKLKLETEHKAFMGTMQELTETATRIDKAMEKFEEAFDYRDHKSVNIWDYPGERKEYIKMLESVYNELKGSEINEENNSIIKIEKKKEKQNGIVKIKNKLVNIKKSIEKGKNMKLYSDQQISIYKLQKDLGLSKQTLYNYTTGKRDIRSMEIALAKKISDYLGLSLDDFYTKALEYQNLTNKRPN